MLRGIGSAREVSRAKGLRLGEGKGYRRKGIGLKRVLLRGVEGKEVVVS